MIFLRVWQDQKIRIDGKSYMLVTHHAAYVGNESSPGYRERLRHVDLARNGSKVYMVICIAKDPDAVPREIGSFIKDDVFLGGEIIDHEGDTWIEQAGRVERYSVGS